MALALDCPHCDDGKIETVREVWFIQGFLLFSRFGTKRFVGCLKCTRSKALGSLALSSVLGWWCFPWGLGTPFVMLQNTVSALGGPNEAGLRKLLSEQGVEMDDLVVDDSGRTENQRRLVSGVLTVLHRMTWADGAADPSEIELGADIAARMLGDMVDVGEARELLRSAQPPGELDVDGLTVQGRLLLLKAAMEVARADGVVDESEVEELGALGAAMGIPAEVVESFTQALSGEAAPSADRLAAARATLGVEADATPAELQQRYQQLQMEAVQLEDADTRMERIQDLAEAYQVVMAA